MRAVHMNTRPNGRRRPEWIRGRPVRSGASSGAGPRLPGLRWVPVPLALLAAMVGWLILGSLQGQSAAASARNEPRIQAGGLGLGVDAMFWMSNDMTGQGPVKGSKGIPMGPSMMPGIQSANDSRLRVEVTLRNLTPDAQRYAISDFAVVAPGGGGWTADGIGHSDMASWATLQPGFEATIDLYFDVPTAKTKNLTVKWSHGGNTVFIPVVNTGGTRPSKMRM
jgi:hypothetical protein